MLGNCTYKKSYSNWKMEVTNLHQERIYKTIEQLYCSEELTSGKVNGHLIFLSVLSIFLSISSSLGNTLILAALRKESSLHPPSKLLYRNLAITDVCVGVILELNKLNVKVARRHSCLLCSSLIR